MTTSSTFPNLLITIIFSLLLTGCNNDTDKKSAIVSQQAIQKYTIDTTLSGKVSNKEGTIREGIVKANDSKNKLISSTEVDKDGHYSLTIPANTELPIILSHSLPNSDKDSLISVVIYASYKKYDINDLTTVIAKKAKSLGGYTHSNMTIAADQTVGVPDANKTSTGFRGDPTSQYGGWH